MTTRADRTAVQANAQNLALDQWARYHAEQTPMAVFYDTKEQHISEVCRTQAVAGWRAQFGVDGAHTLRIMASHTQDQVWGFDAWHTKGPGLPDRWTGNIDHSRAFTWTRESFEELQSGMPTNVSLVPGLFDPRQIQHTLPATQASVISIDCDTGNSTTTVLEAVRSAIAPGTRIIFDEYANYPGWREHEFRAWREFCYRHGVEYQYWGICHMDVSIEVTRVRSVL